MEINHRQKIILDNCQKCFDMVNPLSEQNNKFVHQMMFKAMTNGKITTKQFNKLHSLANPSNETCQLLTK